VEELDRLPGIGPAKAALIVQYRTEHGKFQATEELQLVKGIGEKTFEKLAPMLVLD
jgi:competence protein ComEA